MNQFTNKIRDLSIVISKKYYMGVRLNFSKLNGLIPVIAQDYKTKEVLMLAFMNKKSWKKTLETGKACYWSRTRRKLWVKGETSGNYQIVKKIKVDCDNDSILLKIKQIGNACHLNRKSCFVEVKK